MEKSPGEPQPVASGAVEPASFQDIAILSAEAVEKALTRAEAAEAVTAAIRAGLEPSQDPRRVAVGLAHGQLLLMPSETSASVGLKAATVAPANPTRGLPRIQAAYLLFDADTLSLRAILDGTALTTLRTPAVSVAAAAAPLARFTQSVHLLVFGAGPQAVGHVQALNACGLVSLASVTFVLRAPERARGQLPASATLVAADDPSMAARLRRADVVVCATSSQVPLFDSRHLRTGAVVIAVGSHEPHARELDGGALREADVVVEDVATAMREAGDIVLAASEGQLRPEDLIPMADVIRGRRTLDPSRTLVFKSTGMSWEDLVVAEAVMAAASR